MGIVVDTSAIIELERAQGDWRRILKSFGGRSAFLPSIVWAELMAGVHLADSVDRALARKSRLDRLRKIVPVLPFTSEIAETWAELFAELQRKGAMIPSNDLCVAATAVFFQHTVLVSSKEERNFKRVERLDVIRL